MNKISHIRRKIGNRKIRFGGFTIKHDSCLNQREPCQSVPSYHAKVQRGAKKIFPCLKFPPHFCQAKWPAHAQPIGPDGTCVTQLSSINFARPCKYKPEHHEGFQLFNISAQQLLHCFKHLSFITVFPIPARSP